MVITDHSLLYFVDITRRHHSMLCWPPHMMLVALLTIFAILPLQCAILLSFHVLPCYTKMFNNCGIITTWTFATLTLQGAIIGCLSSLLFAVQLHFGSQASTAKIGYDFAPRYLKNFTLEVTVPTPSVEPYVSINCMIISFHRFNNKCKLQHFHLIYKYLEDLRTNNFCWC